MAEHSGINWADAASIDLGQAWGLSFMCTSFFDEMGDDRPEQRLGAGALQHIAMLSRTVAQRCAAGSVPREVMEAVQRASGVATVVACETRTEHGTQFRDDITDWALGALTASLEQAKAALDEWIDRLAQQKRAEGAIRHG